MFRASVLVVSMILLASSFSSTGRAQNATGKIVGVVLDPSGATVPAVRLTITDIATNSVHVATTDSAGFYEVPLLPIGRYKLTAEKAGFQTMTLVIENPLEINQTLTV